MSSVIGVDLGGTKMAAVRYREESLEEQERGTIATHAAEKFPHVLDDLLRLIERLRRPETRAVGIGVPGLVHFPDGRILRMPNIPGGDNLPLQEIAEEQLGLPTVVENDANCFTFAEALQGAGRGHKVVIGVTVGTGVGGGIVIDGKLFHGARGFAGEIGHMLLQPGQPPYPTTAHRRGEVEQFFSGTALGKRCLAAKRPEEYLEGEVCAFLKPEVFREVAWMCVNLTHFLDPSVIVLGGSTGRAFGPHLPTIRSELEAWLLPGTPLPHLALAELPDAAERGAALLALAHCPRRL
jgi:glucokinase